MSHCERSIREQRTSETLQSLFSGSDLFKIPFYQRAYSWEKEQRKQFLEDLIEQPENTPYYFGHFIFEFSEQLNTVYIIDGQQRLTTFLLFLSCALRELWGRPEEEQSLINISAIENRYLRNRLETVESDQNSFLELIASGHSTDRTRSRSKIRLRETTRFFDRVVRSSSSLHLSRWIKLMEAAEITTFTVHDKVQSTQIFTLQNSRGKELTALDRLKAFLMFEIYLNAEPSFRDSPIRQVERSFGEIYRQIENITLLDEDSVLRYHDFAYSEHWDTPLNNLKKVLTQLPEGLSRVEAITQYSRELASSFQHVSALERQIEHDEIIADPIIIDPANSWPLLIKLYRIYGDEISNETRLRELLRNVEIVLLKFQFQHGRSSNDLIGLTRRLDNTEDGIIELSKRMEICIHKGFRWRSDFDEKVINYLNGSNHYDRTCRYFLWKYENSLRHTGDVKIRPDEFINSISRRTMDSTTEHIAPKNPEAVSYSDEFANKWVNNLGNLLFMPRGMNSSLSNKLPIEKSLQLDTSYASHREVKAIIELKGCWTENEISERKKKIIQFIKDRWQITVDPIS